MKIETKVAVRGGVMLGTFLVGMLPVQMLAYQAKPSSLPNLSNGVEVGAPLDHLRNLLSSQESIGLYEDGVATVRLIKGKGVLSDINTVVSTLGNPTSHGALFEHLCQKSLPGYARFTKSNNMGVDILYRRIPGTYSFAQCKAFANGNSGAVEGLLDALQFAGGDLSRVDDLTKGSKIFEVIIPSDQVDELISKGLIHLDGTPKQSLIDMAKSRASADISKSFKIGGGLERISKAMSSADLILPKVQIRRGPVTYSELVSRLGEIFKFFEIRVKPTWGKFLSQALKGVSKSGPKLILTGVGEVAMIPLVACELRQENLDYALGVVDADERSRNEIKTYMQTLAASGVGLSATAVASVLLISTPVGWCLLAVGTIGAATGTCMLLEGKVGDQLYVLFNSGETLKAEEALKVLRGERSAHISGFTIDPDMIQDKTYRESYRKAWEAAGRPPIGVSDDYLDSEYEKGQSVNPIP